MASMNLLLEMRFLLYLGCSLNTETGDPSQSSGNLYQTERRHSPEDNEFSCPPDECSGPGWRSRYSYSLRSGDRIPVRTRFSAPVQTGPEAHPASYTMGTGSFPGVKRPGRDVDHPPAYCAEVKERVELYLYPTSGPSWSIIGSALPLPNQRNVTWTTVTNRIGRGPPVQRLLSRKKKKKDVSCLTCQNHCVITLFWCRGSTGWRNLPTTVNIQLGMSERIACWSYPNKDS